MKRSDIHTILVPGSGAIVIGQAAEFDYSGTQAVKALRAEGYRVVLVNSNPATIMTDPEIADATYIEPLTPESLEAIIAQEKPDAMLPTVGGQTGLNLALALSENGVLEKYGVQLIGFLLQVSELCRRDNFAFNQKFKPICCFIQFFQSATHHVHKVRRRFRPASLTILCTNRCAASQNLLPNHLRFSRFWETLVQLDNSQSKLLGSNF